jgi:mannose-6-phosphate isomerase-like protein (cupin superfamily)
MPVSAKGFDPIRTYVHLADGPAATLVPVTDDFWEKIQSRADLHEGRLLTSYHFQSAADWDHWERHPDGDEIVCLLAGAMDLVLDEESGERVVELRDRAACVVPRGVWHHGIVRAPSDALFVTRGKGTEHRPLTKGDRRS